MLSPSEWWNFSNIMLHKQRFKLSLSPSALNIKSGDWWQNLAAATVVHSGTQSHSSDTQSHTVEQNTQWYTVLHSPTQYTVTQQWCPRHSIPSKSLEGPC